MKSYIKQLLLDNIVTLVFIILCVFGFIVSKQSYAYLFSEVAARLFRNFGLVFSLVIPVIAGIGLNFGIVLGAMAAQAALIFVTHWQIEGTMALFVCACISTPLSVVFGWLLGKLFNKTKGQEMITGMITGFFANGLYQLFFLVLLGSVIPFSDERIMVYTGVGIKDTLKLENGVAGALNNIMKVRLSNVINPALAIIFVAVLFLAIRAIKRSRDGKQQECIKHGILLCAIATLAYLCNYHKGIIFALKFTSIPVVPFILMILIGLLVTFILNTKLGQDFRSVGSNMKVASAAGIDVDKTRIVAIILSTILASWGQLIFLQSIGTFNTYSSHDKVGLYAIASILVGGASSKKATIKQGVIGIILFHTLFVIAPLAGKALLNNPAYGEYFREAVSYGVVALSLVLHIVSRSKK